MEFKQVPSCPKYQSGMTQVAIGEALGLRQGYVSKVVNGVFYGC